MRISDWSSDVCSSDLAVSNPTSHGTGGRSSATGACEHWSTARAVPSSIYACHAVGALKSRLNVRSRVIRLWRKSGGAQPDDRLNYGGGTERTDGGEGVGGSAG